MKPKNKGLKFDVKLVESDELLWEISEGRDLSSVTSLLSDPMIDLAVAKSFRGGRGGRSLIRGNDSELFLSRVGSWCSGRRLENATRSSARDRALPPRYNTLTRLPHQLLLTRAAFRSSDSPRTARSRNAGEILLPSPTSSSPGVHKLYPSTGRPPTAVTSN